MYFTLYSLAVDLRARVVVYGVSWTLHCFFQLYIVKHIFSRRTVKCLPSTFLSVICLDEMVQRAVATMGMHPITKSPPMQVEQVRNNLMESSAYSHLL